MLAVAWFHVSGTIGKEEFEYMHRVGGIATLILDFRVVWK